MAECQVQQYRKLAWCDTHKAKWHTDGPLGDTCPGATVADRDRRIAELEGGDAQMELLRRLPLPSNVITVLVIARDLIASYDSIDGWRGEMDLLDAALREFCGCDHNVSSHNEQCALSTADKEPTGE
jgi:hypothetical protein